MRENGSLDRVIIELQLPGFDLQHTLRLFEIRKVGEFLKNGRNCALELALVVQRKEYRELLGRAAELRQDALDDLGVDAFLPQEAEAFGDVLQVPSHLACHAEADAALDAAVVEGIIQRIEEIELAFSEPQASADAECTEHLRADFIIAGSLPSFEAHEVPEAALMERDDVRAFEPTVMSAV